MRRLRANGMVVSQKTYLELDDVVPSWIEAVVANFFVVPQILSRGFGPRIFGRLLVEADGTARPRNLLLVGQLLMGKTLKFGDHLAWLHVAIENRHMSLCLAPEPCSTTSLPQSA